MQERYIFPVVIVFFLVSVTLTVLFFRASRPIPPVSSSVAPLDLSGGASVQRNRIEDFIARVGRSSVEELEKSLADGELTVEIASLPSGLGELNRMAAVMADRRVAKLYAEYERLGEQAQISVQRLADFWLNEHRKNVDRAVAIYKEKSAREALAPHVGTHHACAAAAFLLMRFGGSSRAVSFLEEWEAISRPGQELVHPMLGGLLPKT